MSIKDLETLNFDLLDLSSLDGKYGMPVIKRTFFVPDQLLGFNYMLTDRWRSGATHGIHFFIEDSQFERLWKIPEKYVNLLRGYQCVLAPDFSLYTDMPLSLQIYNVYRNRLIGQYLQRCRVEVIPTIQFSDEKSFEFCFDGIEPGGVMATSMLGCARDKSLHDGWRLGMDEAIRRLKPSTILCYGTGIEYGFKGIKTVFYRHPVKKWGRRE